MKRTVTGCNVSFVGSNLTVHSSARCAGQSHGAGTQPVSRLVSEPDPSQYEEGSGHSRASELSPGRNVDLTNQNR